MALGFLSILCRSSFSFRELNCFHLDAVEGGRQKMLGIKSVLQGSICVPLYSCD